MGVDVTVLAVLVEDGTLVRVLAEPVDRVVFNEVGVRIHHSLVLIVDLVLLFEHEQAGLDLHEPGLDRHEQRQVLAELVLLILRKIVDPLQRFLVGEKDLKGHKHATILVSIDVHSDLVPQVAKLGPNREVVLVDLLSVAVVRPLSHREHLLDLLANLHVLSYALLPI